MRRFWRTARVVAVSASFLGSVVLSAPGAAANPRPHDVDRSGSCSGASHWHLDAHDMMMMDDIWVYFEVDSHTAGQVWKVTLADNGSVFWSGTRTTNRRGDFHLHDWTHDRSGTDQIVAKGVNRSTGEVCRGAGSL